MPGVLASPSLVPSPPAAPGVLRLTVSGGTAATPVKIEIVDNLGEARLRRNLAAAANRGRPGDCIALAETVALIVDRFLHELGYEAPPTPPPPPPPPLSSPAPAAEGDVVASEAPSAPEDPLGSTVDLLGGVSLRTAETTPTDLEVALGLGAEAPIGTWRAGATLTGGFVPARGGGWNDKSATLRRFPFRLGLFLSLPAGPGRFQPGAGFGLDWLTVDAAGPAFMAEQDRLSPSVDAALAYRLGRGRVFLRAAASMGVALMRYEFRVYEPVPDGSDLVFRTPATYVKIGIESGVSFQ